MNPNRPLALATSIALAAGIILGRWVVPATSESSASALPSGHPAIAAEAGGREGQEAMPGVAPGDGCQMENCDVDRPKLEARLAANPNDLEALTALGSCDLDMGSREQGVDRLKQAATLATGRDDLLKVGVALQRAGEADLAIASFEKGLVAAPKDPELLYRAGLVAFHNQGKNEAAIGYWRRYLDAAPNAPNAEIIRRAIETMAQNPSAHAPAHPVAH